MATDRPPWGWTARARAAMAAIVAVFAVPLLTVPGGREAAPPPPGVAAPAVDPNTAPRHVLLALPALGPTRVERLVAAREEAPFTSPEEVRDRVSGIGPATLEAIRPHLRIGPGPAL